MAEIFAGRAVGAAGFERRVVVKRLLASLVDDAEAVQSLVDEARIQALLTHPNIPVVYELGLCEERGPFIVMEHLEGLDLESLHQSLRGRGLRLSLSHAIYIVDSIAAALHCAHELCDAEGRSLGLIHRDVSPPNIFIAEDGEVKLLDFGVSKSVLSGTRTYVGYVKGKAPYMSPEQCLQERLDRRTDIFSLGVVLYEISTGTPLFRAAPDDATAMQEILGGAYPRPSQRDPEFPQLLERVIFRALAPQREDRFVTANEFRAALADVTPQVRPEPQARLGVLVRSLRAARDRASTLSPNEPTVVSRLAADGSHPVGADASDNVETLDTDTLDTDIPPDESENAKTVRLSSGADIAASESDDAKTARIDSKSGIRMDESDEAKTDRLGTKPDSSEDDVETPRLGSKPASPEDNVTTPRLYSASDLRPPRKRVEVGDETIVTKPPEGFPFCEDPTESYGLREQALADAERLTQARRAPNELPAFPLAVESPRISPATNRSRRRRLGGALALGAVAVAAALAWILTNL